MFKTVSDTHSSGIPSNENFFGTIFNFYSYVYVGIIFCTSFIQYTKPWRYYDNG